MSTDMRRLGRLGSVGVVMALLLGLLGVQAGGESAAYAATGQFRGVNWADPSDNFVTGDLQPVGLSDTDSYATVYAKATSILKGFQGLGANTVRMPFNRATVSGSWWGSYSAAWDAASALGMNVVVAPWLQNGVIGDSASFYSMWDVVINKYLSDSHFYFDVMNEPWGYNATDEDNLAAAWVAHYPQIPRGRILVPGAWSDQNLCTVGADSRLSGTLLSIHDYTLGGETHPTESGWVTSFENNLCGYDSRAVLTEFGVPMNTGVNYDGARDGTNDVSYLYALTDTAHSKGIGTLLWTGVKFASQTQGPGPCENASCAITSLQGTAPNYSLSINNRSGLDRLQYSWGGASTGGNTVTVTNPGAQSATAGTVISPLQVHATDSAAGQTLSYTASGLPSGLSISSTGLITGTPSAAGSATATVTATDTTGATGSASFTWTVSPSSTGGGTCHVTYTKNEWQGGFTANVTINNTGGSSINGWTLTWSFPGDQKVTNAWNATVTQSGTAVRATNLGYNATIAAGGNVQFGFQGTWVSNDTVPVAFALNQAPCT